MMSVLCSAVASLVVSLGTCGMGGGEDARVTLAVQHPDSCFLLSPKPLADGLAANGDIVSVKPGMTNFELDCNGNQVSVKKEVKEGAMTLDLSSDLK